MAFVTVAEAKEYLQISHSAQDNVLAIFISAAISALEKMLDIKLDNDAPDYVETLDGGGEFLRPSFKPINSISKIEDLIGDYTFSGDDYEIVSKRFIRREYAGVVLWPTGTNRIRVTYKAGYTEATLPSVLKLCLLSLIQRMYANRGGIASESNQGVSVNWQDLNVSDIQKMAQSYNYKISII